jgi:hypothetical protein
MIYLVGGAARSGKTILTQRLLKEHGVPYFCMDYFVTALENGCPELGIDSEEANITRTAKVWPRIEYLIRNIAEVEPAYTVDGDALSPTGVESLVSEYGSKLRPCFIGYANISPLLKLHQIRTFTGGVNDWIQDHTDEYILDLIDDMIAYSCFAEQECHRLSLPYFDVSDDFPDTIERVYAYLTNNIEQLRTSGKL